MISKLSVHGNTREEAIKKMSWALSEFIVGGIDTNIEFQLELIRNSTFEKGTYDVGFIEKFLEKK